MSAWFPPHQRGLEATAITEFAGPFWTGRALGVQNTTQRRLAAGGPPLFGALITASAYPACVGTVRTIPAIGGPAGASGPTASRFADDQAASTAMIALS